MALGNTIIGSWSNDTRQRTSRIIPDKNGKVEMVKFYNAIIDWSKTQWFYMWTQKEVMAKYFMEIIRPMAIEQRKQELANADVDWSNHFAAMEKVAKLIDETYCDPFVAPSFKKVLKMYGPAIKGCMYMFPVQSKKLDIAAAAA